MITNLILNVFVLLLGALFSWLPQVTSLPFIVGYDIDTALVQGMGQLHFVLENVWPLLIMFQGFLALLVYFGIKMAIKFFLGSRSPSD